MGILSRKPLWLGAVGVLVAVMLLAMVAATVYANWNGPEESNDHADDDGPSHSSYVVYTMVSSDPFEAEVTNVEIGGRPSPDEWYTSNEVWASKMILYRKWTGSKWQTVRTAEATWWSDHGEPGDLEYINDTTDVTLPGGALVQQQNQYAYQLIIHPFDWIDYRGAVNDHYLEDY